MASAVGTAIANWAAGAGYVGAAGTASYVAVSTAATLAATYAVSELASSLAKQGTGTEDDTKTQNYAAGSGASRVILGRNKLGGKRWLLKATDEHIVYGVIHGDGPIEAIDKTWIGDKPEDHSDFSNVEMTEYTTYFSGSFEDAGSVQVYKNEAQAYNFGIGNTIPYIVEYRYDRPIKITSYIISRLASPSYDDDSPENFTLSGSNDGLTWTTLNSQTGELIEDYVLATYPVTTTQYFSRFKLEVTAVNNGSNVRINDLTLNGVDEDGSNTGGDITYNITIDGDSQDFSETVGEGQDAEEIRDLIYDQILAHGYNNIAIEKRQRDVLTEDAENDHVEYGFNIRRTYGTTTDWDFTATVTNDTAETGLEISHIKDAGHAETKRYIEVVTGLGATDQTANDRLLEVLPDTYYDEKFRAQGKCWTAIIIDKDFFKEQLGQVPTITSEIRGRDDITNSRTGKTGYTENPIDLWAWYLKSDYYYEASGRRIYPDQLPDEWIIADANLCDEQVPYNDEGDTHARYAYNGSFLVDSSIGDIMSGFASSVNIGSPVPIGGAFRMRPMAYHQPTKTITVSDLADDWTFIPKPPADENYDAATGSYIHADQNYATESYPITYLDDADTSNPTIKQVDFLAEVDPYRAQRNAGNHIRVLKDRATYSIKTKVLNFELSPTETVYLEVPGRETRAFYVESTTRDNLTQQYEYVLTSHDPGDYSDNYINFTEVEVVDVESAVTVRDDIIQEDE